MEQDSFNGAYAGLNNYNANLRDKKTVRMGGVVKYRIDRGDGWLTTAVYEWNTVQL